MSPLQFVSNRYCMLFLYQDFLKRLNKQSKLKVQCLKVLIYLWHSISIRTNTI